MNEWINQSINANGKRLRRFRGKNSTLWPHLHCVSKNDTDVAHYNFNAHQPILVVLGRMLPGEYAIKYWFVISPLLANVSALLGEHEPQKLCLFSHAVYRLENEMARQEIIFAHCN